MQSGLMQLLLLLLCCQAVAAALQPIASTTTSVSNVAVHRVPLYRNNDDNNNEKDSTESSSLLTASPYCFAVSNPMTTLKNTNFLATQVWPSARIAAMALERYIMSLCNNDNRDARKSLTICEFGCGPGLPSLTAAVVSKQQQQQQQQLPPDKKRVVVKVYATDLDSFALELVQAAAKEQSVTDFVETRRIDLTTTRADDTSNINNLPTVLPAADLYLFSDVFESSAVAQGAARTTCQALQQSDSSTVWVFCQSDRAQRQVYIQEMQHLLSENSNLKAHITPQSLSWRGHDDWPSISTSTTPQRLWLCNVDETKVRYG